MISGLHLLAGFMQIAMLAIMLAGFLTLAYAGHRAPSLRAYLGHASIVIGTVAIGCVLAAFSLLADARVDGHSAATEPESADRLLRDAGAARGMASRSSSRWRWGTRTRSSGVAPTVRLPVDRRTIGTI